MAINLQIYSNAYNTTKTVIVDFVAQVASLTSDVSVDDTVRSFFKFSTSAKDTSNLAYTARIVENLSDLALNGNNQSADGSASAYSNVKSMITDYAYDYIHGHTLNQSGSGCTAKAPMKFSS